MPTSAKLASVRLNDRVGKLIQRVCDRWLLTVRETNPAILTMFRDRELKQFRHPLPWSGEFAGKHLTACAYVYRLTRSDALYAESMDFIREMLSYQLPSGYLGPFPEKLALTGECPPKEVWDDFEDNAFGTWDAWGHYHIMWGLLLWYDISGKTELLDAAERMAGLFLRTFTGEKRLVDIGSTEMNLAPLHVFAELYVRTKKPEYLAFAERLVGESADERAGNYLEYARQNLPFYQCPKPRWESLHIIMGFARMADATGDRSYLDAAQQIFFSILDTDVHNSGGFSTTEQAVGNPHTYGPIETCCVVAYNALASQLYLKTGDVRYVEFLERAELNAILGSYNASGRWSTYDTPMTGVRRANYDTIQFQSKPGSPDLNCCSVNAPRGLAQFADWGYVGEGETFRINWLGDAELETASGDFVRLSGNVFATGRLVVEASLKSGHSVEIRIPAWSKRTSADFTERTVDLTGESVLRITESGAVSLFFEAESLFERGTHDVDGLTGYRRGAIVFGIDAGENPELDMRNLPAVSEKAILAAPLQSAPDGGIIFRADGVTFRDFGSLGKDGNLYTTWFPTVE